MASTSSNIEKEKEKRTYVIQERTCHNLWHLCCSTLDLSEVTWSKPQSDHSQGKRRRQSVVFESQVDQPASNAARVVVQHHKTERSATNPNAQTTHNGGAKGLGRGPKQCQCALAGPRRRREISLKSYYLSLTLPLADAGIVETVPSLWPSPFLFLLDHAGTLRTVPRTRSRLGLDIQITHDTMDSVCFVCYTGGT